MSLKYGVPQGSCSSANNFVAYCAPVEHVVSDKSIELNGYADDHSLRKSFKPSVPQAVEDACLKFKMALTEIGEWMSQMQLKLNKDKTEFIMFGHKKQLAKCNSTDLML